jgi:hypothetical protein
MAAISFTVDTSGLDKAMKLTDAIRKQMPFATSRALNQMAFQVSQDLRNQTPAFFDRPNAYTRKGFFYTRSTKADLVATVTAGDTRDPNDRRRQYLARQIVGGTRVSKSAENKTGSLFPVVQGQQLVPTRAAKRNSFGNVPRSFWGTITADNPKFFVGKPQGGTRSFGIYQRFGPKGRNLKALMVAQDSTQYSKLFPMERIAYQTISRNWSRYLASSLEKAIATAK